MMNRLSTFFPSELKLLQGILICLVFVPTIKLSEGFYFCLEDLILLVVTIKLLLQKVDLLPFVKLTGLLSIYIGFTILLNPNRFVLNEYFEVFKMIKIGILVTLCYRVLTSFNIDLDRTIKRLFMGLVIFNLFHYFNVFYFNSFIEPFFDTDGVDLKFFGLNSDGLPAAKRMLGTLGNPNNNAVLFLFFSAYFLSRITIDSIINYRQNIHLYLSFLMILLCQSRTGILTFCVLIISYFIFQKVKLKTILKFFSYFVLVILIVLFLDYTSVSYFTNTKVHLSSNTSITGRYEMWKILIDMFLEKPIFGWGPNKNFIYSQGIYPENEFLFLLWKFGVVGTSLFLYWLIYPIIKMRDYIKKNRFYLYILIIIFTTSITNTPLSNPRLLGIFSLLLGYVLFHINSFTFKNEKV